MFSTHQRPSSYLTQIRNVALLPEERVTHVFSPQDGVILEPTSSGRLLLTTSHRIISFSEGQGNNETFLVPIEELKGIMVKSGARNSASLVQGLVFILSGLLIYFVLSYWLTGRFDGPTVPLISIDLGPLILLLGIAGGGWLLGKHYLTKEGGAVTFQGSNWAFTFPYSGDKASEEVQQVIKTVFTTRNSRNGYYPATDKQVAQNPLESRYESDQDEPTSFLNT